MVYNINENSFYALTILPMVNINQIIIIEIQIIVISILNINKINLNKCLKNLL